MELVYLENGYSETDIKFAELASYPTEVLQEAILNKTDGKTKSFFMYLFEAFNDFMVIIIGIAVLVEGWINYQKIRIWKNIQ